MGDNYPFTSVDNGGPVSRERLAEIREQAEYCSITVEAEELLWLLGQADDAKRLRAENTAQAEQLAAVKTLRGRWAAVTEAEATPSWDISRHHEQLAAFHQLQHCATQLGAVIDAVGKLQDRWNAATTPPPALGLDQDGRGQANAR